MIEYHPAKPSELDQIIAIENQGFTKEEAASKSSMAERIAKISDTFIVASEGDRVLGYIVGPASDDRYIADELFDHLEANNPTDSYQTVLSLVVEKAAQGRGIASRLLNELAKVAQNQNRSAITLTCLKALVPFYERNGYVNEGVSDSKHAGETWYNMVLKLN